VISQDPLRAKEFLTGLKQRLKQQFKQEEILIIEREIGLL
jgi:hypothetical protein